MMMWLNIMVNSQATGTDASFHAMKTAGKEGQFFLGWEGQFL
jgi:hypothetical protein